jgi:tetratricopeptide (TPR) repeat protein
MTKKNVKAEGQNLELEGLQKVSWIEKNKKKLIIILSVLLVLGVAAYAYFAFVIEPNRELIKNESVACQKVLDEVSVYEMQTAYADSLTRDSLEALVSAKLNVVLNGDDAEVVGFKYLADEYSSYQSGKLAALYTGICYYELGQYAEAIEYLDQFEADDLNVMPAALQLKGDAYVCLQDYAKALEVYAEVVETGNKLIAPMSLMKSGLVHLELGDKAAAKAAFETIKKDYPASTEAQNIDKYIAIAE